MLEIPTADLEQRIMQELMENPTLELGNDAQSAAQSTNEDVNVNEDDGQSDDIVTELGKESIEDFDSTLDKWEGEEYSSFDPEDDWASDNSSPDYLLHVSNYSADDEEVEVPLPSESTFHDYLTEQLGHLPLSDKDRALGEYIILSIDDDGYLRRSAQQLADDITFSTGVDVSEETMAELIARIQELDPAGVGASNLQQCLLLQLKRCPQDAINDRATLLVTKAFPALSKRQYRKIQQRFDWTDDQMQEVVNRITHLNPKPGALFAGGNTEQRINQVTPDFIVENDNGILSVSLNNADIPPIHISEDYQRMLQDMTTNKSHHRDNEGIRFLKQHIEAGRWFIDALQQRNTTLLNTMQAIVRFQQPFFREGDDAFLKPMILQDIAEITGYDISTISRVSNEKYVRTAFGTYPLRHFFSEGLDDAQGQEVSTRRLKRALRELIDNEDKRHPLNDDQLVEAMQKQGYVVARRTIAKYRDMLGISVARLRKEM